MLNDEQYLHTQVVTRVASEAAAAAASSAVIAVFETQKKLLSKVCSTLLHCINAADRNDLLGNLPSQEETIYSGIFFIFGIFPSF